MIEITQSEGADPMVFSVTLDGESTQTHHRVTLSRADAERLGAGKAAPVDCVEAAFRFLLDREPPGAILERFDISDISRYFPDFEQQFPSYVSR
ncbi:hypothetical protein GCM10007989_24720 [Devosia pacifica]|uniref:Uncharacterized protein n=1 Tax=Devosia pacifica TaxID=1335967 RepID=A0A918VVV1_9HYPH|nr:hypothetical protein [Devosia pacifica]GHA27862.1 hypothetical protein GCM10007989_24720 [Devosia pacifica]